jgi:hypothetical protein
VDLGRTTAGFPNKIKIALSTTNDRLGDWNSERYCDVLKCGDAAFFMANFPASKLHASDSLRFAFLG